MGEIRSVDRLHGPNLALDYCVVDTETSGFSPDTSKLLEIAAVKVRGGHVVEEFSTLVRNRTTQKAMEVNHITPDMLKTAPNQEDAVAAFRAFVGNDVLVAHNARFDKSFIDCVSHLPNEWIDTLAVSRMFYAGEGNKLADMCKRYGVPYANEHRALDDCRATHACWLALRNEIIACSIDARDFPQRTDVPICSDGIWGKRMVFTGGSDTCIRHDLMEAAWNRGAILQNQVTQKTDYVVVLEDDMWEGRKVAKARELASKGFNAQAVGAEWFLGLVPEARQAWREDHRQREYRDEMAAARLAYAARRVEQPERTPEWQPVHAQREEPAGRVPSGPVAALLKVAKWCALFGAIVFAIATPAALPDPLVFMTAIMFTLGHLAIWWLCRCLLQGVRIADILRPQGTRRAPHGDARHFAGGRKA